MVPGSRSLEAKRVRGGRTELQKVLGVLGDGDTLVVTPKLNRPSAQR
jgi:hypothetical protein